VLRDELGWEIVVEFGDKHGLAVVSC
jgi:hypothetical protein